MKIYKSSGETGKKTDRIFMLVFLIIFTMCFLPFFLKKVPDTKNTETVLPAEQDTEFTGEPEITIPPDDCYTVKDKPGIRLRYSDTVPDGISDEIISAEAAVLYDRQTNTVLYSKNADKKLFPASTTKIVTACAALRYLSPDTILTVGSELDLIQPDSSLAYLNKDSQLTLEDALYALLLPSGNDAAYVIAVNTARIASGDPSMPDAEAVKYFSTLMNDEAYEAGAEHTNFCVPDGYHDPNHYTTAEDLLKITIHSAKYPLIAEICREPERETVIISGQGYYWENGNLLVTANKYNLPSATGLKTGFTDEAGYCMSATANDGQHDLIAIILNAPSLAGRYTDASRLFWSVSDQAKLQESFVTTAVTTEPPPESEEQQAAEDAPVTEPAA